MVLRRSLPRPLAAARDRSQFALPLRGRIPLPQIALRALKRPPFHSMDRKTFDCTIIGGGIVGLATALSLLRKQPGLRVLLLEKEPHLALHQTGRNSGVIHSGIYYKPGSFKARFAREGNRTMVDFCNEHGIAHEVCGKVIVATQDKELPLLEALYRRGLENGLDVGKLSSEVVREIEPHVRCLGGIKVPSTGIVSFREVCSKYAELFERQGGQIRTATRIVKLSYIGGIHIIETTKGTFEAGF